MKIKIVFIDVDGTLVETSKGIVAQSSIDAIRKLHQHGIQCVLCTGRPPIHTMDITDKIKFDAKINLNGGYVEDSAGQALFENPLSSVDFQLIWDYAKEHDCGLCFHFDDFSYGYHRFDKIEDFFTNHVKEGCSVIKDDPTHTRHLHNLPYNGVMVAEDEQGLIDFVAKQSGLRCDKIFEHVFDVFRADNDKARAIEILLKKLGLEWHEAAAIGDSTNDLKMLEMAGCGIAMGNASEYVKGHADWISSDVAHDGVANAIEYILKNNEYVEKPFV